MKQSSCQNVERKSMEAWSGERQSIEHDGGGVLAFFTHYASRITHHAARAPLSALRSTLLLALSLVAGGTAHAHDPGLSVATARRVGGALSIHLAMASSDVERLVTLDANHDGRITEAEFQGALPQLQAIRSEERRGGQ